MSPAQVKRVDREGEFRRGERVEQRGVGGSSSGHVFDGRCGFELDPLFGLGIVRRRRQGVRRKSPLFVDEQPRCGLKATEGEEDGAVPGFGHVAS